MAGKEKFQEVTKYTERFKNGDYRPKKCGKLGFMSADFPKRDQYTINMSTEQLRETLKKENRLMKKCRNEEMARYQAETGSDGYLAPRTYGLKHQNLYDVVYRVPNTSFRHKYEDRQTRFFYMEQRKKEASGTDVLPPIQRETKWVQAILPSGKHLNVLVSADEQVIAQKPSGEIVDMRASI